MVLKIVSNCSLFVSLEDDTDRIEFYGLFFLFGTLIVGFFMFILSLEIASAIADDLKLWNGEIVTGSYAEIITKLPKPIVGLCFLMLSSFISLTFPYLITFLSPSMKKEFKANASKRLPQLSGTIPLIIDLITLAASILGIVSFYLTQVD